MISSNPRLKKSMRTFVEYLNELQQTKSKGYFIEAAKRMENKIHNKNLILNFRNKPKSKNIDAFLSHRIKVQKTTKSLFENGMRIPFVLPLFSLEKSNLEEFGDLSDLVMRNSMVSLGCHNIADRISISNPKKFKSIRTMFSFPHMGLQKEIKEITKGEFYLNTIGDAYESISTTRRLVDTNGKLWINHSINAIKNGSEWYQSFGEEGKDTLPLTRNNNSYSQEFYDRFGNDVFVDVDKLNFQNMGVYHSLTYKYLDEFDFENFSPSELEWVEEWLDFEFIGLIFRDSSLIEPSVFCGLPQFGDDGKDFGKEYYLTLIELGEEIGFDKIAPLTINWKGMWETIISMGKGYVEQDVILPDADDVRDAVFGFLRDYENSKEHINGIREKVEEWKTNPPSETEIKEKQKRYYKDFMEHTFDFKKKEIITPKVYGQRYSRIIDNNRNASSSNRNISELQSILQRYAEGVVGNLPHIRGMMEELQRS